MQKAFHLRVVLKEGGNEAASLKILLCKAFQPSLTFVFQAILCYALILTSL